MKLRILPLFLLLACRGDVTGPESAIQLTLVSPPVEAMVGDSRQVDVVVTNTGTTPMTLEMGCNSLLMETQQGKHFATGSYRICVASLRVVELAGGVSIALKAGWNVGLLDTPSRDHTQLPAGRYTVRGRLLIGKVAVYSDTTSVNIRAKPE
ncbi:MAG TPA: hypothetical protein VGE27_11150 [Gemmatimonas sp.]|uniref:hypothetical protein n=1 Tax=Gemmatimonas sp. TaxID=1962908 RepID=UPI002ED8395D